MVHHPHHMEHENHLLIMIEHAYTHLFLLEREAFRGMVTHLDPYIITITRYNLTRTLIPNKLKKEETDVYSFIDVVSFVVVSYDFGMPKTKQDIFQ